MGLEHGDGGSNQETKTETTSPKFTGEKLEQKFARRAKEIKDRIKQSEESQRVTNETMNLEFHTPGVG